MKTATMRIPFADTGRERERARQRERERESETERERERVSMGYHRQADWQRVPGLGKDTKMARQGARI